MKCPIESNTKEPKDCIEDKCFFLNWIKENANGCRLDETNDL